MSNLVKPQLASHPKTSFLTAPPVSHAGGNSGAQAGDPLTCAPPLLTAKDQPCPILRRAGIRADNTGEDKPAVARICLFCPLWDEFQEIGRCFFDFPRKYRGKIL